VAAIPTFGGLAFLEKYLVGYGLGTAAGPSLEPYVQELANLGWEAVQIRPMHPQVLAPAVAEEVWPIDDATAWANKYGVDGTRFGHIVESQRVAPSLPELWQLLRRNLIGRPAFTRGLRKARLQTDWDDALLALRWARLSPADVANAVQQGFLAVDGLLPPATPADPDPSASSLPYTLTDEPVSLTDDAGAGVSTTEEGAAAGVDADRMKVMAELAGLPPGPMELLEMWRRGIINETSFATGIATGHTKTRWTGPLAALFWNLLPASVLVNLRLRGWIDDAQFHPRMARLGYKPAEANDWYLSSGRPIAPQGAIDAVFRGVMPHSSPDPSVETFERAIVESDIRPEWAKIFWGNRFHYPSLFQLRRAVSDGSLSPDRARVIMHYERYEQQDIDALIRSWTGALTVTSKGLTVTDLATEYEGGFIGRGEYVGELEKMGYDAAGAAAKADAIDARRVRTARNQRINRIRMKYVGHQLARDVAAAALSDAGVQDPVYTDILDDWDAEREVNVTRLTNAQIKRAYRANIGGWTYDAALLELENRGMTPADADTFLKEPDR
jgi:hypothetical protein